MLGLNAPEAATLAGGHQVQAHERQVAVVAPEEVAFASPLASFVRDSRLLQPPVKTNLNHDDETLGNPIPST